MCTVSSHPPGIHQVSKPLKAAQHSAQVSEGAGVVPSLSPEQRAPSKALPGNAPLPSGPTYPQDPEASPFSPTCPGSLAPVTDAGFAPSPGASAWTRLWSAAGTWTSLT